MFFTSLRIILGIILEIKVVYVRYLALSLAARYYFAKELQLMKLELNNSLRRRLRQALGLLLLDLLDGDLDSVAVPELLRSLADEIELQNR